ncbi:hypothetical protein [Pseudomonas gingeri]|uniref:Uncharacterized protein n=1 Tax=Pseudomonas gingeri TaxID=117681 RepID=A0A7Y8CN80_9PSED|nr:hypothetical protein [Pseudomonas gingeri]NVZ99675.1 hypothetical protein [Pseudomonas gingeri]NWA16515.1 hypothetical protein [Pseudomonas gingeri]NWA54099.1 hypothetical protein [Pseudomonas gingeri]NWA98605.1 hypothetical protein [Pseudomonas gingeri]NWB05776.1 hypothetical protein [Pseudomonas gingeri]
MKMFKSVISVLALATLTAGSAFAGPPVAVTFKNLGTTDAAYTIITGNEASTNVNAVPKPVATVRAGGADTYTVQSNISPNANYANLRYTMGGKTCTFLATYVGTLGPLGSIIPKWNNTATPSGGAVCTAKVTSTNISTYSWTVEFTMK